MHVRKRRAERRWHHRRGAWDGDGRDGREPDAGGEERPQHEHGPVPCRLGAREAGDGHADHERNFAQERGAHGLGEGARDEGRYDADRVRRYLSRLRVPLHVWKTASGEVPAAADWPAAVDASTIGSMGRAFDALRKDLASQRIIWFEGRHAPSTISLTAKAKDVAEAR